MIIFRYFFREITSALMAVTSVLVLVLLCQQFIRYLGLAVVGKYPVAAVFKMLILMMPHALGLLLPLGLFLGVLLAYGRLHEDSEMVVLKTSGLCSRRLMAYTLSIALTIALVDAFLTLWLSPQISSYRNIIKLGAESDEMINAITPGRFHTMSGGVYYVDDLDEDESKAKTVFMAKMPKNAEDYEVVYASVGHIEKDKQTGDRFVVLEDGNRYTGEPGGKKYQMISFERYGIRVPEPKMQGVRDEDEIPTKELFKKRKSSINYSAELHWRLAMPLSILILALIAMPLSHINPRGSRFGRLFPAILIYILYVNALFIGQDWLHKDKLPIEFGLWGIHAAMLAFAVLLGRTLGRHS